MPLFPVFSRRPFIGSIIAATTLIAAPAIASTEPKDWTLTAAQLRTQLRLKTKLPPGEIHVDPNTFSLY